MKIVTKASKFDIGYSLLSVHCYCHSPWECWWLLWIPINASLPAGSVYGVGVMCCHWYLHLPLHGGVFGGGVFAVSTYNCHSSWGWCWGLLWVLYCT